MPWIVLLASAILEAVWATALGASNGFTQLVPRIVFGVALVLSMLGLGYAARHIPISTAYAIWTGTGAALTVAWGMLTGAEGVTLLRVLFLAGIVCCVIGLKLVKPKPVDSQPGAEHFSMGEKRPTAARRRG
jgi:quaternary ammonium compound-resistance protein SugE